MNLLNNLKYRYEVAKNFTAKHKDQVENLIREYKAENYGDDKHVFKIDYVESAQSRYRMIIPLIFTYHEAMMASMFDRVPDLVFTARGQDDEEKKLKVEASYRYLVDKLDLEWFLNDSAWWFILTGFSACHATYKQETAEMPVFDEMTGEPVIDPETGEPMMQQVLTYDDPIIEVDDQLKTVWSPESEFSIKAEKIPYYFTTKLMEPMEVEQTYGVKVEPDARVEDTGKPAKKFEHSKEFDRCKVRFYYGTVSYENRAEVEDWDLHAIYYVVMTDKKILYSERIEEKHCRLIKWYGAPNEFFGFGLGKLLRPFQHERSVRRSQMLRYGDVAAYPRMAVDATTDIDEDAAQDPRELPVLVYSDKKPEYLSPPDIGNIVIQGDQAAETDAQKAAGLLDLASASQNASTVDTATGQTIFAEASERRVRKAKKQFTKYYREVVIMLLKLAQKHWTEEKVVSMTDERGNDMQVSVSASDLSDVDFDTDIDIDAETLSINKDVLRQQAIELYNVTKDDPLVERRAVFTDMIRMGFNVNNPDRYVKDMELIPGQVLLDTQTGQQYMVGEDGELTTMEDQAQLADPTGNGASSSQAGIMGASQNMQRGV